MEKNVNLTLIIFLHSVRVRVSWYIEEISNWKNYKRNEKRKKCCHWNSKGTSQLINK
jgi:hypothetical protein